MSQDKLQHEAERWLQTAHEDLRAAQALRTEGLYAHACFMAQQCAEKAVSD
jgi:HEPN domain-containing protein